MKHCIEHGGRGDSAERGEPFVEELRRRVGETFRKFVDNLSPTGENDGNDRAQAMAREIARDSGERVSVVISEMCGVGSSAEAVVSLSERGHARHERMGADARYRVALVAALATGCASTRATSGESLGATGDTANHIMVSGDPQLSQGRYGVAEQPAPAPDESHRDEFPDNALTPEHAPTGYGMHQWKGYSEYNPVAVAWLAIKNIGDEPCTVEITRLELSYAMPDGSAVLGSSRVNGVQQLGDGTDGEYWGKYLGDLQVGSTFTLSPHTADYVHPFGQPVVIPDDAEQVTVTFSARITEGCVVGGGMDTYSDFGSPRTTDGYTQNGSPTDFIKEAVKMPFVGETVPPEKPMSYAIPHKTHDEEAE